jgi:hypothetical protein
MSEKPTNESGSGEPVDPETCLLRKLVRVVSANFGEWRVFVPERRSFVDAIRVTLVGLHTLKSLPPKKE